MKQSYFYFLMAATPPPPPPPPPPPFFISIFSSSDSSSCPSNPPSQMQYFLLHPPLLSIFFFTFSLTLVILLKINKNRRRITQHGDEKPTMKVSSFSHPFVDINKNNTGNLSGDCIDINSHENNNNNNENDDNGKSNDEFEKCNESEATHLTHSLLLSFLPSDSATWEKLFVEDGSCNGPGQEVERAEKGQPQSNKKKKKRAKKKKPGPGTGEGQSNKKEEEEEDEKGLGLVSECPFTTSSSATQRRIKQQYDQLVKSHQSNGLTLAQVGQFVNCLIEARNELQHKSEVIQRKFTITKALLFRADRSSFDRLRQQIYKLEIEQKRLEEDACVYNWLQQQLKLSPAYKKMLEIGACMEMKAKSSEPVDSTDAEFPDISFEELLAREKKDSFWLRHRKPKQCAG